MTVVLTLVFIVVQLILLPISIVGSVVVGVKQILGSKKLGLSGTAIDVLQSRWILDAFGDRKDPVTIALAKNLPNMSHYGMWLAMSAVWVVHRLFGFTPGFFSVAPKGRESLANFMYTRHLFFDDVFERSVAGMDQVVFMGAGFDTRAFTFCRREGLAVFELDQPNMQRVKRDALAKAGLDARFIRFVPVDFSEEAWDEKLFAAGFDSTKKTLYLWEGVTPYLLDSAVTKTLRCLSEISAPGSILTLDLYSLSFIERVRKVAERVYKKTTGETFHFGLDLSEHAERNVETFLNEAGFALNRITLCGDTSSGKESIVALVEAGLL